MKVSVLLLVLGLAACVETTQTTKGVGFGNGTTTVTTTYQSGGVTGSAVAAGPLAVPRHVAQNSRISTADVDSLSKKAAMAIYKIGNTSLTGDNTRSVPFAFMNVDGLLRRVTLNGRDFAVVQRLPSLLPGPANQQNALQNSMAMQIAAQMGCQYLGKYQRLNLKYSGRYGIYAMSCAN